MRQVRFPNWPRCAKRSRSSAAEPPSTRRRCRGESTDFPTMDSVVGEGRDFMRGRVSDPRMGIVRRGHLRSIAQRGHQQRGACLPLGAVVGASSCAAQGLAGASERSFGARGASRLEPRRLGSRRARSRNFPECLILLNNSRYCYNVTQTGPGPSPADILPQTEATGPRPADEGQPPQENEDARLGLKDLRYCAHASPLISQGGAGPSRQL